MGVPAFFRWLTRKYASVVVDCVEQPPVEVGDEKIYPNSADPNPNNVEFDNLYLDMNGIIHPCTHPESKPAPKNEDEMMIAIFECIDRLFRIVRPRKVLYMAIDGVAPRAKMNQQRSRRFRASKETAEKLEEISRIREDLKAKGVELPPEKPKGEHFDSNCITPGTPFMARLSICLHYYIHDRLNNDPGWKGIKVILSDANVPGEGEHKIMDYIRKQRAQPDHDPNTQHCLCGADADLIMLGLATHEPNFTIIREEFKMVQERPCEICGQTGHVVKECMGVAKGEEDLVTFKGSEPNFIFVRLCVLREYLERELNMPNLPFPFDLERAIDDWVFMCFFVGNDFLPHLPSLEIREGAIDRLVRLYKDAVYKTGGWLTDSGDVNLDRVQLIMSQLGEAEDNIFKERQSKEQFFRERNKKNKMREKMMRDFGRSVRGQFAPQPLGRGASVQPVQNARQEAYQMRMHGIDSQAGVQAMLRPEGQAAKNDKEADSDEEPHDEVRLWEDGFKERYYASKFECKKDDIEFRHHLAHEYVLGLCWVLKYYYQGCASWKWYFPFHYAPFASDFVNVSAVSNKFEKGTQPFRPLEQLMGVFPAASSDHVPAPWATLMTSDESEIIDFYPVDFKIDLNGKKFAWQGVALLPFVDEQRLFKALEPYYKLLTPQEIRRNIRGDDRLYISKHHPEFSFISALYENEKNMELEIERSIEGMRGRLLLSEDRVPIGDTLSSPVKGLDDLHYNQAISIRFRDPKYDENFIFPARRLPKAVLPPRILRPEDFNNMNNSNRGRGSWRPQIGMAPARQRASLDVGGHRMLNAGVGGLNNFRSQQPMPLLSSIPATLAPPPVQNRGGYGYSTVRSQDSYSMSRSQDGYSTSRSSSRSYETGYSTSNNWNSGQRRNYGGNSQGGNRWESGGSSRSSQGHSGNSSSQQQQHRYKPYDSSRNNDRGGNRYRGNSRGGRGGGGGNGGGNRW